MIEVPLPVKKGELWENIHESDLKFLVMKVKESTIEDYQYEVVGLRFNNYENSIFCDKVNKPVVDDEIVSYVFKTKINKAKIGDKIINFLQE